MKLKISNREVVEEPGIKFVQFRLEGNKLYLRNLITGINHKFIDGKEQKTVLTKYLPQVIKRLTLAGRMKAVV